MDEFITDSVNTGEVAATPTPEATTNAQVTSEPQVDVASQPPMQTEEQNRAFAQYRREAERARKADEVIAKIYKGHGIKSVEELEKAMSEHEKQAQAQQYKDKGIDPELINKLIEENPTVQEAKRMREEAARQTEFNKQADALFKEFPKLNAKDVPEEVLKMNAQQGIPLNIAYKAYMYGNAKVTAEQEAIKGLKQNQQSTPGSLSNGNVPNKTKLPGAGTKEFKDLLRKVERGEVTDLSQL